ncbi:MAG: hypothetical protein ABL901_12875 [Hyphomicrobiaceae bacterium]
MRTLQLSAAVLIARRVAIAGAVALSVSACGAGDIQLNGKVFDAIGGLVGSGGANESAKLPVRSGLVVPPGLENLPQPGSAAVPDGALAEIQDHDRKKVVDKSALEAKQREYCKVNYEQAKQRGDNSADGATGPLGPCRPSALGLVKSINSTE